MPPYVIFPDSTLVDMLRQRPTTLQDMSLVSGVGSHKLERYGADFLQVLGAEGAQADNEARLVDVPEEDLLAIRLQYKYQCYY